MASNKSQTRFANFFLNKVFASFLIAAVVLVTV